MVEAQEIIKFWNDGLTATEIGEKIGKTRSAVLGKVNRMRAKGVLLERRVAEKTKAVRPRGTGKRRNIDQLQFDISVDLFSLKPNQCHYIVGRFDDRAMYCASSSHKRSMCKTHYEMCYYRLKD